VDTKYNPKLIQITQSQSIIVLMAQWQWYCHNIQVTNELIKNLPKQSNNQIPVQLMKEIL